MTFYLHTNNSRISFVKIFVGFISLNGNSFKTRNSCFVFSLYLFFIKIEYFTQGSTSATTSQFLPLCRYVRKVASVCALTRLVFTRDWIKDNFSLTNTVEL